MTLEILKPQGVAKPQGMYNHAISVGPGKLLFISGQVSIDEKGDLVGLNDFTAQLDQVYENLGLILKSAGADFGKVVKFTTYLTRTRDMDAYYQKRSEIYSEIYPDGGYPTNTLVVIEQLAREEWLVEIEAIAALL
jgi:enamine deaminase RidA (YjgF/YER057c/UK114 family)